MLKRLKKECPKKLHKTKTLIVNLKEQTKTNII